MKRNPRVLFLAMLFCPILTGCGQESVTAQNELEQMQSYNQAPENIIQDKYRNYYEVFVYSFYDSDGDGIGDLKGLTQKLDYIYDNDPATDTDLGCNGIWMMPIDENICVLKKEYKGEEVMLIWNLGSEAREIILENLELNDSDIKDSTVGGVLLTGLGEINKAGGSLSLPPYSMVLLY